MSLENLQADFVSAIFGGERDAIAAQVRSQGGLSAAQRVGIYRNSVHGTLCKYLVSLYPVCEQLLGERFFEGLADEYIDTYPPSSPFLMDYGNTLADFMQVHEAMSDTRWIAAMARLEWARHLAWNGINQPVADFARLTALTSDQQMAVCFSLPGSAQLIRSGYAVHAIWMAHQPEDYAGKIPLAQIDLHTPCHAMVWRVGRSLRQWALEAIEMDFLEAVSKGRNLEALGEQFQEQLPVLLSTAIQKGWVTAFREGA